MTRLDRGAVVAAVIAASLGAASAAVSAYWALGGTALIDTVGGEIERWGRERSAGVVATLWVITLAKLVGAVAPLVLVGVGAGRLPAWTRARPMRALGWIVAIGLTVYGGVLTVAGLLVEAGVIDAADDADEHAIAWHAFFWDPWFLLWGVAFAVAMWCSRPRRGAVVHGHLSNAPDTPRPRHGIVNRASRRASSPRIILIATLRAARGLRAPQGTAEAERRPPCPPSFLSTAGGQAAGAGSG